MTDIDAAVTRVLQMMFAYGLITSPRPLAIKADASSAEHQAVALSAAEKVDGPAEEPRSGPPVAGEHRAVAVIGADAGADAVTSWAR